MVIFADGYHNIYLKTKNRQILNFIFFSIFVLKGFGLKNVFRDNPKFKILTFIGIIV